MLTDKITDVIRLIIKREGLKYKDVASHIGLSSTNFSEKLKKNTLTAQEFVNAVKYMGYDMTFGKSKNSIVTEFKKGKCPRVKKVVNGISYDTSKSDALCCTEICCGFYIELYRDTKERFFVVEYANWTNGVTNISPLDKQSAKRIYDAYGDGTCDYMFD